MNYKHIGAFITKIRKAKDLSQQELADLIPITREAVSKWECGKNKPDKSNLKRLSEIFNVTIDELLLGDFITEENKSAFDSFKLNFYENYNKKQKLIIVLIILLVFLIFSFLTFYFLNSYNSIKVYTLNQTSNDITISNGIFVVTKEKLYFNLGDLNTDEKIVYLKLFYKEDQKEKLIYYVEDKNIILYDYYGYNAYFDYNKSKYLSKNMFLEIGFENDKEILKLNFKKDFANNKVINDRTKSISSNLNDRMSLYNSIDKINLIKKNFEYINDVYIFKDKNNKLEFSFFEDANLLNLIIRENNIIKEWNYYLNANYIIYNEYENNELIDSFYYENKDLICNMNDCNKDIDKLEYFYDELDKFLS